MASEVSQNISNTLKSINLEKPTFSTLAQKGNDPLVQQFLSENMELGNEEKETVQSQLYIACFWGFHEVVKTLIERGADVNHKNADTLWTPLHAAAFQENGKIIMFLLEHNANPYSKDFGERTPADFASVSDKIWPLFAACGCTKSSRMILVEKGILRKAVAALVGYQHMISEKDVNSIRTGNSALLINYNARNHPGTDNNKRSEYAASVDGDVLAGESSSTENQEEKPNFSAWRN
ncbi:ankyrin repeat and SOCS box protein 11-like isoform X3 [Hydractinia symbiolongicarpus]|uniref:ankyrin repeat and SOCS box protein 11-like isoform X3 n=1 Tax=Hydractinia symbiolongicarpus TaxID=13093 RepID=UPI002550EA5C|nr:ankyrin repeat and SOCS box protein 11-like isoform X3 [Hydractinia symbiolongicarpus]